MASGVVVYWWKVEGGRWNGVRLSLIGNWELGTDNWKLETDNWKLITHNCEL